MKRITFLALIAIVIYLLIERDREQQEGLFWRKRVEAFEARDRQRDEQAKRDEEEAKLYLQFLREMRGAGAEESLTEVELQSIQEESYDRMLENAQFDLWLETQQKEKGNHNG